VATLHAAKVPFLIGGAYVVEVYAGVSRGTKDFDLYVLQRAFWRADLPMKMHIRKHS